MFIVALLVLGYWSCCLVWLVAFVWVGDLVCFWYRGCRVWLDDGDSSGVCVGGLGYLVCVVWL